MWLCPMDSTASASETPAFSRMASSRITMALSCPDARFVRTDPEAAAVPAGAISIGVNSWSFNRRAASRSPPALSWPETVCPRELTASYRYSTPLFLALAHLGHPDAQLSELVEGFRVPGEVIDYAARLLPSIAPQLSTPRSIRHNRGELVVASVTDPVAELPSRARLLLEREGTLGVIVPDAWEARVTAALDAASLDHHHVSDPDRGLHRLDVVPATLAKGLEFDHVLLLEPAQIVAGEPDRVTGLRRLYVCLTRAVTSLVVLAGEPVPAELGLP